MNQGRFRVSNAISDGRFFAICLGLLLPCGAVAQDSDGDSLPDAWEMANGSDHEVDNGDADFDRDHLTLSQEYSFQGATLSPHGTWRAIAVPLPPGVTSPSMDLFRVQDLNSNGVVLMAGYVPPNGGGGWVYRSWLWSEESGLLELPNEGSDTVYGVGLNDHNEVVGVHRIMTSGYFSGFHFSPWGGLSNYDVRSELGIDPAANVFNYSFPRDINNDGEIIGFHQGHGAFYQDWLGGLDGFEFETGVSSSSPNVLFSGINNKGAAVGTYTDLLGNPKLFVYQPQLGGGGFFNFTNLDAAYPPGLLADLQSQFSGSLQFSWQDTDEFSDPMWDRTSFLNDYGEFVGQYEVSNSQNPNVPPVHTGTYFFDGSWTWDLYQSEVWAPLRVAGLNSWPSSVYQVGDVAEMFHDHVRKPLNQLAVVPSSDADPTDWSEVQIRGLNEEGEMVVIATDATSGNQGIYILVLDQDVDGDGLPNDWETFHNVTSPSDDPDGDSLPNSMEFAFNLDPNDPASNLATVSANPGFPSLGVDDDGDGIPNTIEAYWGMDPNSSLDASLDFDGDGLSNLQEFLAGTSALSVDTDRDGVSDLEEVNDGMDPTSADSTFVLNAGSQVEILSPLQK